MTERPRRRNPLLPWWIGIGIIAAAVAFVAYRFSCTDCGSNSGVLQFLVLGVIPVVYLLLMYLTFRSEDETEHQDPSKYDPR